jgi:hypothetical protein
VIPHASAAETLARVSSAHSVGDAIAVAVAGQTAAAAVPIAGQIAAVIVEAVLPAPDSNAVPAVPEVHAMIVVTAIPVRRAVPSSSAKC